MDRRAFLAAAAAAPFALRAGAAGGASGPVALVTADTEARVVAVSLDGGRVRRAIATAPGPRSIETVGGRFAVVAHTASAAVTILDGRIPEVLHVLHEFDEPRYTAAHPDGVHAFVTDSGRADVATVDVRAGRVLGRLRLGAWPRHLSLDPTAATLWISLGNEAREVAVVDVSRPAEPRLAARIRPPFLAHDVVFDPSGRRVWITSGAERAVAIYETSRRSVLHRLDADAPPQHVAFFGAHAFVTSGDDGTLRVHARNDGRLVRTTPIPRGSYNVQQAVGRVLTPSLDAGTLCVLDAAGHVSWTRRYAASSHDVAVV